MQYWRCVTVVEQVQRVILRAESAATARFCCEASIDITGCRTLAEQKWKRG